MEQQKELELSKQFCRPKDVAKVLGVTKQAITRHIRLGRIAAIRLGANVLIPIAELQRFQEAAKMKGNR